MSTRFATTPTRNDAHTMQKARHELAALVDRVRELNGWSDSHLVARAIQAGERLSKSNLSRIRNTDVVSITGSTIRALAAALGVSETEVAMTSLRSMGIETPDSGTFDLDTVIKIDSTLSADNRTLLLSTLKQMRQIEGARETFAERAQTMGRRVTSSTLTEQNQGTRTDYELARREGQTQRAWELKNEPQPEDEPQGNAPDGGA